MTKLAITSREIVWEYLVECEFSLVKLSVDRDYGYERRAKEDSGDRTSR